MAMELKKWLEERELSLGYTDNYTGHLASWIQEKITQREESVRMEVDKKVRVFQSQYTDGMTKTIGWWVIEKLLAFLTKENL